MPEEGQNRRIRVQDRRRARQEGPAEPTHLRPEVRAADEPAVGGDAEAAEAEQEAVHDYLEDLRRLQAEFENFKKQNVKRQTELIEQANTKLVHKLLPILDNFERAAAHGADASLDLIYKELRDALGSEGLESIAAKGAVFDPNLHEAVETRPSEDVDVDTVIEVYRTGYRFKNRVIRPAMVVVAHHETAVQESED
ncbi:MAG: nucleotide exchange factor GrpE [Actinobacteria bacterium]|nr:nucleotide exchange factor GrpE [Actinomycetota bacterium]